MNHDLYFQTITQELASQKDRLEYFIRHWLTIGEFRETILRNVLRRHLPQSIGIGKGFILTSETTSTQTDIIFYDTTKPVLFKEGELLILTPDAVLGAIEVKKRVTRTELEEALTKLSDIVEMTRHNITPKFFGLFAYENSVDADPLLSAIKASVRGSDRRIINCVSIGESLFARYWPYNPDGSSRQRYDRWHAYNLQMKAPAYFLMNVVSHLCRKSVDEFESLWFPTEGKEPFKVGEATRFDS